MHIQVSSVIPKVLYDGGICVWNNHSAYHRQLTLIRHAVDHPGMQYSIKSHRLYHNVSYQTARTDLLGAAELELLIQTKIGKAFFFLAPDDLHQRLEQDGKT